MNFAKRKGYEGTLPITGWVSGKDIVCLSHSELQAGNFISEHGYWYMCNAGAVDVSLSDTKRIADGVFKLLR